MGAVASDILLGRSCVLTDVFYILILFQSSAWSVLYNWANLYHYPFLISDTDLIMPQFSAFVDITDNSWKLYIMPQPSKSKRTEIKQIGPSNNPRKSLANWLQRITFSPRVIVNWENKQNLVSSEYSQRAKSCVGAPNLILVSEQRNTEKSIRPECYIGLYSLGLTENMVLYMTWNYWTISLDK